MLAFPYFDAHAHISDMENPEKIIERASLKAHFGVMNVCTSEASLLEGIRLSKIYPFFHNAAATVPTDVENADPNLFSIFENAARAGDLAAIGETGLDYFYGYGTKQMQIKALRQYLRLAWELSLPLIFHCRNAFSDLFAICDAEFGRKGGFPAMVHCFTGTKEEADGILEREWYLSCSGIITYPGKKTEGLRNAISSVPLDKLLVETDCPFLAPQSVRGKVNEPSYLFETIEALAKIKDLPVNVVGKATFTNASRLFSLTKEKCL